MKPKSDIYDTLTYGIVFAGFGAAAYGMFGDVNVNVPVVVAGLGAGIIAGTINDIKEGFQLRKEKKEKGEKLEELFI
ncbi:MAG: hypothetical protein Q8N63_04560 [Nanoarchaeota archaeon]|nr:hypothetical protein [Nanoarchaeota archaeon]